MRGAFIQASVTEFDGATISKGVRYTRMSELVTQYGDLPLGTTDVSVVAIAERFERQRQEAVTGIVVMPRRSPQFGAGWGKKNPGVPPLPRAPGFTGIVGVEAPPPARPE